MDSKNESQMCRRRSLEKRRPIQGSLPLSKIRRILLDKPDDFDQRSYVPSQDSIQRTALKTNLHPYTLKASQIFSCFLPKEIPSIIGTHGFSGAETEHIRETQSTKRPYPPRKTHQFEQRPAFDEPITSWPISGINGKCIDFEDTNPSRWMSHCSAEIDVQRRPHLYNKTSVLKSSTSLHRLHLLTESEVLKMHLTPLRTPWRSTEKTERQCVKGDTSSIGESYSHSTRLSPPRNHSTSPEENVLGKPELQRTQLCDSDGKVTKQHPWETSLNCMMSTTQGNLQPQTEGFLEIHSTPPHTSPRHIDSVGSQHSSLAQPIPAFPDDSGLQISQKPKVGKDLFSRLIKKFRMEEKIKRDRADASKLHPFSDEPILQSSLRLGSQSPITGVLITSTDDLPWNKKRKARCAGSLLPPLTYKYETSILATEHLVYKYFPSTSTAPPENPPLEAHVDFETPIIDENGAKMGDVVKNVYRNARKLRKVQKIERLLSNGKTTPKKRALLAKTIAKYSDLCAPLLTVNDEVRCVYRNILKGYN